MYYGYGHGSWILVLIPLAFLVLRGLSSSGRRRGQRRPQAPPSFFMGPPGRPSPHSTSPTASAPSAPAGQTGAFGTGASTGTPAGWFTDPFVKHEQRYWSGTAWTEHVLDDGVPSDDPPPPARSNDES